MFGIFRRSMVWLLSKQKTGRLLKCLLKMFKVKLITQIFTYLANIL
jgi:hypothetical protein